jgi:outer membrane protein TolC
MATDLDKLVGDLSDYLTEAVKTAEETMKSKKKSNVKPHDLYKLKTALEDLRQKKLMAVQGRQTAERAVAWVSGMTFQKLPSHRIAPEEFQKRTLDEYLKLAHANRPEFRALKSGQAARLALADAKQAQSYPVLFLGGFFQQSLCSVCDSQPSIFANDPFNRTVGGGGIGLKFDLEFWRHSAEAAEQRAEAMKLKMTESYAVPGIDLQVKRAFWEVEQQQQGLEIAERRKATARKWFVSNAMGWSIGLTPPKELLEALEGDGLSKKNYIETVYALNMALAHLTQAVGVEVTSLKYR